MPARGNAAARIFSLHGAAAGRDRGHYRTTETELPGDVLGKPAQVRLDGDALVVEALES